MRIEFFFLGGRKEQINPTRSDRPTIITRGNTSYISMHHTKTDSRQKENVKYNNKLLTVRCAWPLYCCRKCLTLSFSLSVFYNFICNGIICMADIYLLASTKPPPIQTPGAHHHLPRSPPVHRAVHSTPNELCATTTKKENK